jgi:MFS family permease
MTTTIASKIDTTAVANGGILSREKIIAKAGFNRWLVPPAALAIHLCIGMAYGFSVFWLPLSRSVGTAIGAKVPACTGAATTFWDKTLGTLTALTATKCEWTQFDLGWMFTLFFVVLGLSAAAWGGWLEHAGPRKAGVYAALCWCGGLMISAIGVRTHQLWMLWIGSGVIGGIGLGLGYISPVSTLVKWFPDRRGMATGMAIMGFGGGAMIGSPLANLLMNHFKTPDSIGVWQTFVVLALGYFVYMIAGAFGYRVPPDGWSPQGWTQPATQKAMITADHVALKHAHKTPQFWLIWAVLCLNVSAGIGIIGAASPMLQETFGGALIHDPSTGFTQFSDAQDFGRRDWGRIRRTLLVVQHRRQVFLGNAFRFDRPQDNLFCVLRARRDLLRRRARSRGHEGGRGFRGRVLHHRLDVRWWICHRASLSRGYFRHAVCRRHSWPFAHCVVDGGDHRSGDRQLPA